ncbi:MAG: alanyl-tRNA editing protein [Spirochaetaceae bacterium]|nr:alanyl-tRNA editing protein [Spirochaetaceae bacterium]
MATIRRYYEHPTLSELDSVVTGISERADGSCAVTLSETIFYPEGGGQPCDLGTLAGLPLEAVLEEGDEVAHILSVGPAALAAAGVSPAAAVRSIVDLGRRIDHSEQHSAQHLLSSVLLRAMGARTLSFHLGERHSFIDLDIAPFGRDDADAIEDEVTRIALDDYRVTTHLCPPEDPASFPLRKEPSVEAEVLRVIEIDGIEYSACCGTHVASTRALEPFRILKVEKYKGGCRVYFVAGGRARADYRRVAGIAARAASAAGCADDELEAAVRSCRERQKELERSLAAALDEVAAARAEALDPPGGASRGATVFAAADGYDAGNRLARALARRGRVAVVDCGDDLKAVVCSPSGGTAVDAAYGRAAMAAGGKGGGGKAYFQAAFPDRASLDAFLAAARGASAS